MKYSILFVIAASAFISSASIPAVAGTPWLPCYAIYATYHICDPNQYYCSEYEEDSCIGGGCNGPVCSTGWGYCCGHSYPSQIVSGDPDLCDPNCLDGQVRFRRDLAVDIKFHRPDLITPDARQFVMPVDAYYIPSKCNHLFGILEPADLYQVGKGAGL